MEIEFFDADLKEFAQMIASLPLPLRNLTRKIIVLCRDQLTTHDFNNLLAATAITTHGVNPAARTPRKTQGGLMNDQEEKELGLLVAKKYNAFHGFGPALTQVEQAKYTNLVRKAKSEAKPTRPYNASHQATEKSDYELGENIAQRYNRLRSMK